MKLILLTASNLALLYVLIAATYYLKLPEWLPMTVATILLIYSLTRIYLYWKSKPMDRLQILDWQSILCWVALAIWIVGIQSKIVVFGTAQWFGDWSEHYERSIWFLRQLPLDSRFLDGMWTVPARGPLFNACAAFFLSTGDEFYHYQLYSSLLNTFPLLPFVLLVRKIAGLKKSTALFWGFLIFAVAPVAVKNEVYPWTKFFTLGWLLAAIYFYRLGQTEKEPWAIVASFAFFAFAILAHYLAIIFLFFFALHFLYTLVIRRFGFSTFIKVCVVSFLILISWFGFLFSVYGLHETITANSTFGSFRDRFDSEGKGRTRLEIFASNMLTTMVPYSWRHHWNGLSRTPRIKQSDSRAGREVTPTEQELNLAEERMAERVANLDSLTGSIGITAAASLLLAFLIFIRARDSTVMTSPGPVFWLILFIVGIPVSISTSSVYSPAGTAMNNLQLYFCLLAVAALRWLKFAARPLQILLCIAFLLESVLLDSSFIHLQERRVPIQLNARGVVVVFGKLRANFEYVDNMILKMKLNLIFLSDYLQDSANLFRVVLMTLSLVLFLCVFFTERGREIASRQQTDLQKEQELS